MLDPIKDYNLLSNRVYKAVKKAIHDSLLQPGEKVTETRIANELGVSRTPVREALRILNSEGYIRQTPNSSFVVSSFTLEDVREILAVRGALEGEAARIAAQKITNGQARLLEQTHDLIRSVKPIVDSEDEAYKFYRADAGFHEVVMEIAGNKQIMLISNSLRDRMYRMRIAVGKMPDSVAICALHHRNIMEAILNRDGDQAAELSRFHTSYIAETVLPLSI
jgi:DNA-binding GntR family transcriptional regulator